MSNDFFGRIWSSLSKTRGELIKSLERILPFGSKITEEVLDEIEETLYEADLGIHASELIVAALRERASEINRGKADPYTVIKESVLEVLNRVEQGHRFAVGGSRPWVMFVAGVNGVGKTTTIGKLAMRFRKENRSVLLAACDTFRAAAVEQLGIWADRADAEFIKGSQNADPASVAYDAIIRGQSRDTDIVIIDTAGRLHTSRNLMQELKKIRAVSGKALTGAPHETLLVLDATTGHNAFTQAEIFHRELDLTGIALTKLDGTAKGGIVVSIVDQLEIPVKLIGIGEGIDDLRDFDPDAYVDALFTKRESR